MPLRLLVLPFNRISTRSEISRFRRWNLALFVRNRAQPCAERSQNRVNRHKTESKRSQNGVKFNRNALRVQFLAFQCHEQVDFRIATPDGFQHCQTTLFQRLVLRVRVVIPAHKLTPDPSNTTREESATVVAFDRMGTAFVSCRFLTAHLWKFPHKRTHDVAFWP